MLPLHILAHSPAFRQPLVPFYISLRSELQKIIAFKSIKILIFYKF